MKGQSLSKWNITVQWRKSPKYEDCVHYKVVLKHRDGSKSTVSGGHVDSEGFDPQSEIDRYSNSPLVVKTDI